MELVSQDNVCLKKIEGDCTSVQYSERHRDECVTVRQTDLWEMLRWQ
jgi:hypothetical protein